MFLGGKKWIPRGLNQPQPKKPTINQSVAELIKPLGEKTWKGNVWGSIIMNVEKGEPIPSPTPSPTPTPTPTPTPLPTYILLAENGDLLQTESGDFIEFEH